MASLTINYFELLLLFFLFIDVINAVGGNESETTKVLELMRLLKHFKQEQTKYFNHKPVAAHNHKNNIKNNLLMKGTLSQIKYD